MSVPPFSSEQLAAERKAYFEAAVDVFGASRRMFEGDFPVASSVCSYSTLWNTYKHLAAGASADEKTALFSGTLTRVYRLIL